MKLSCPLSALGTLPPPPQELPSEHCLHLPSFRLSLLSAACERVCILCVSMYFCVLERTQPEVKDSESRDSLCRFFPIKDEPSFSHCEDTTGAGPQYTCMCSWAGVCRCAHAESYVSYPALSYDL